MANDTQLRRMAEAIVPDLETVVTTLRGDGRSWRQVADDLTARTNGVVTVSYETWRSWFRHVDDRETVAS
jgi:hypothetical protein